MTSYTLDQFVNVTSDRPRGDGLFQLENDRCLQANLNGMIWIKMGAMVAYTGAIKFTRESVLEHGIGKMLKQSFTAEGIALTRAEGQGDLYLADNGKKISILNLQNEAIYVNGNDILAFDPVIDWDIKMMRKLTGIMAGGLFNIKLEGTGMIAITTHYNPLTLRVKPGEPVMTDPNATVAWSANLQPEFKTDISFKTFLGRGSGDSIQMLFEGDGFVVVQPYEEVYYASGT